MQWEVKPSLEQIKEKDDTINAIIKPTLSPDCIEVIRKFGYLYSSNTQMSDHLISGR